MVITDFLVTTCISFLRIWAPGSSHYLPFFSSAVVIQGSRWIWCLPAQPIRHHSSLTSTPFQQSTIPNPVLSKTIPFQAKIFTSTSKLHLPTFSYSLFSVSILTPHQYLQAFNHTSPLVCLTSCHAPIITENKNVIVSLSYLKFFKGSSFFF